MHGNRQANRRGQPQQRDAPALHARWANIKLPNGRRTRHALSNGDSGQDRQGQGRIQAPLALHCLSTMSCSYYNWGLSHRIKHLAQSKAYVANCPIPPVELCIVEPEMFIHKTLGMLFQSNVKRSKVAFAQTPKSFSKTPRECSSIIGCSICWYASLQLYR